MGGTSCGTCGIRNFPRKVTSSTSPCFLVTSKFYWFAQSQEIRRFSGIPDLPVNEAFSNSLCVDFSLDSEIQIGILDMIFVQVLPVNEPRTAKMSRTCKKKHARAN